MAAAGGGVRPSPIPGLLLDRCWQPVLLAAFVTTQPAPTLLVQVFAGAMAALAAMTVLSAALGWAAPNLVRPPGLANEHPWLRLLCCSAACAVQCCAWPLLLQPTWAMLRCADRQHSRLATELSKPFCCQASLCG